MRIRDLTASSFALLFVLTGLSSGTVISSLQADPGLACSLIPSTSGPYSASFNGTVSGGTPPYHWTLHFGDGFSTNGTIGFSGGSYHAVHTYATSGTYTAEFASADSKISSAPDSCDLFRDLMITGPVTVNATLAESIGVAESAQQSSNHRLTDLINVADTALSPAVVVLRESINLVDNAARWAQNLLSEIVSLVDTGHLSSTATSESSSSTSGGGGGGGLDLPIQLVAIPVAGLALLVSYLVVRWYRLR